MASMGHMLVHGLALSWWSNISDIFIVEQTWYRQAFRSLIVSV